MSPRITLIAGLALATLGAGYAADDGAYGHQPADTYGHQPDGTAPRHPSSGYSPSVMPPRSTHDTRNNRIPSDAGNDLGTGAKGNPASGTGSLGTGFGASKGAHPPVNAPEDTSGSASGPDRSPRPTTTRPTRDLDAE
jgi:hypothetical protein